MLIRRHKTERGLLHEQQVKEEATVKETKEQKEPEDKKAKKK